MRVIAGKFRSRGLSAPEGLGTRPTSDRLRETLFNVLAPRIAGATFADLYAGSGAVGIEALSRGAGLVYFVESGESALDVLRANLKVLKIVSGYGLEPRTVSSFLRRQAQTRSRRQSESGVQAEEQASATMQLAVDSLIPDRVFATPVLPDPFCLDVVFLDPPYESDAEYATTLGLLGGECSGILTQSSLVIAEHARRKPPEPRYGSLHRYRLLEQGDAALSFYQSS